MELKEKLVSSFIAFENQISLDNTFVHNMRTENMKGDFIGIGVRFYNYKDTIAVIRPIEGGPSFRA